MKKALKKVVASLSMFLLVSVMGVGLLNASAEKIKPTPKVEVLDNWLTFDVWTGSGVSSVTLDNDIFSGRMNGLLGIDEFKGLQYNGNELDHSNYTVTEVNGKTVITLTEKYLKTLNDGAYWFNAEFLKATVRLKLHIVTHKVVLKDAHFDFDTWTGSGLAEVRLDPNTYSFIFEPMLFEKLLYNGNEVDRSNYSISAFMNESIIILKEEYLKTLSTGEHYFEADFLNANINLKLKVDIKDISSETSTINSQNYNDNPQTDDHLFTMTWLILLSSVVSLIVVIVLLRNGNRGKNVTH